MADDPPSTTPNPGRWKPGQSGNPSGRPKTDLRLRDLAREHTETALSALVEIVLSTRAAAAARVSAAIALLDRGWGKPITPVSTVDSEGNDRLGLVDLDERTDIEKARRIAYLLAQGLRALPAKKPIEQLEHEQANRDRDLQRPSESSVDSKHYPESLDELDEEDTP